MKEIRIAVKDIIGHSLSMELLSQRGFPIDPVTLDIKKGLKYSESLDPKTDEIVLQWREE